MRNRDVFLKDPSTSRLANGGVANISTWGTSDALDVLRFELETFVCDGQYRKGLVTILDSFLMSIDKPEQPAVWVSGFFGSGKSHLVKMLRALWDDTALPGGASARGTANLPQDVRDLLKELANAGTRHGGLHAASGTLGTQAKDTSVRLAILRLVFESAGLPSDYSAARLVLWLKQEGILDEVRTHVEANGRNWDKELANFWVSSGLPPALVAIRPGVFPTEEAYAIARGNMFPNKVTDVDQKDMIAGINDALAQDGKFPLTLVILDEVQQYIGGDSARSLDVQLAVEACGKAFGGKLLFVATGQSAIKETPNLKKLQGRFSLPVELQDADVDTVVRKVILAKKPEAIDPICKVMETNLGEVSKHLLGTAIAHQEADRADFPKDYPLLPVRRRFWERTLRMLDETGASNQLRNYLSMIHKAVSTNLDAPLGNVISTDFLFFDAAPSLLTAGMLPRNVYENTQRWINGTEDEQLKARAIGLIFLITRLNANDNEIGVRATVETLADLLVTDIASGGSDIRSRLPGLLDSCDLLMNVNDEYRIHTKESSLWHAEFTNQRKLLANESHRTDAERSERIKRKVEMVLREISITQGSSKVLRRVAASFEPSSPEQASADITVWLRDGWGTDEKTVLADARAAGSTSATIFAFIPKQSPTDLATWLTEYRAACATLDRLGASVTHEGKVAKSAMETTRDKAEAKIEDILDDAFAEAKVFQGGGSSIPGGNLKEILREAATIAQQRLYPNFSIADNANWGRVFAAAKEGVPDALKHVGDNGEPTSNPVCKAILAHVGQGKKGKDVRAHFETAPYGWPRDAVDGGIQVLLAVQAITAADDRGRTVDPRTLDRNAIGKTYFKTVTVAISTADRIRIRKVMQKAGIPAKPNEEADSVNPFLKRLQELAQSAGGEGPKPQTPDISLLEGIEHGAGNEQLRLIADNAQPLLESIDAWTKTAELIAKRWPKWETLKALRSHAQDLPEAEELLGRIATIEGQRQLLLDPDPVEETLAQLTQVVRDAANKAVQAYEDSYAKGMLRLREDAHWQQLDDGQQTQILDGHHIQEATKLDLRSPESLVTSLNAISLKALRDAADALQTRFDKAIGDAIANVGSSVQVVTLPRNTLKTKEDIATWMATADKLLNDALAKGPVMIR